MKIIIVGCGKVGLTILTDLLKEDHLITIIDKSTEVLKQVNNTSDTMTVCGNGVDPRILEEAGAQAADLLIATTGSDEQNMLCCFYAKRLGCQNVIPRVRNPDYDERTLDFMCQQLNVSSRINPDRFAAQEIVNILRFPNTVKVEYFSQRSFVMAELVIHEDSSLIGVPLIVLRKNYNAKFLVCCVQRDDTAYVPDGSFVLNAGDRIVLTAAQAELTKLMRELGILKKRVSNVMLLGGSRIALYITRLLQEENVHVKIIDKDRAVCQNLTHELPEATIICGDGSQHNLLLEENLAQMDALVSLTGIDEENILFSYYAQCIGVPTVITKINREELHGIAGQIGLETIVSPRIVASEAITRYARALHNSLDYCYVEKLYKLLNGKAEALEFHVREDFERAGIKIQDMNLKPGILISGIIRGRKKIIPSGSDVIMPGDRIVVLVAGRTIDKLEDILR